MSQLQNQRQTMDQKKVRPNSRQKKYKQTTQKHIQTQGKWHN